MFREFREQLAGDVSKGQRTSLGDGLAFAGRPQDDLPPGRTWGISWDGCTLVGFAGRPCHVSVRGTSPLLPSDAKLHDRTDR